MSRYANHTNVSKDRSLAEIEATLSRYGATDFVYGWSQTSAVVALCYNSAKSR